MKIKKEKFEKKKLLEVWSFGFGGHPSNDYILFHGLHQTFISASNSTTARGETEKESGSNLGKV